MTLIADQCPFADNSALLLNDRSSIRLPQRPHPTSATVLSTLPTSKTESTTSSPAITRCTTGFKSPAALSTPLNLPFATVPRQILTRRRRYIEANPAYFSSASTDAELCNPLEYDRLVRQHQSAAEREAEGKRKGWIGTLEAGLIRGEARVAETEISRRGETGDSRDSGKSTATGLKSNFSAIDWSIAVYPENNGVFGSSKNYTSCNELPDAIDDMADSKQRARETEPWNSGPHQASPLPSLQPSAFALSEDAKAQAKAQGEERWRALLVERFVAGRDENFDYNLVDDEESLDDDWAGLRAEEEWYEEQEAEIEGTAEGETGVQDF